MRTTVLLLVLQLGLIASQSAGQAQIDVRKVRTLVDRNGRGFTREPMMMVPLAGGHFALQEINELPMVVDSTGRLVQYFGRGQGPGEFAFNATSMAAGPGDTLYAGNQQTFNVYGPDLKFVRSFSPSAGYAGSLVPIRGGFVLSAQRAQPPYMTSLHVVGPTGSTVRSFLRDTLDRRAWPHPSYRVGLAAGGAVWTVEVYSHRIEKWSLQGRRLMTIAARPVWFDNTRPGSDGRPYVRGVYEADGVLWVMSAVPVRSYRQIMSEALKGRGNDVDARFIPDHKLSTTRLEAYDATTGRLLAELPIDAYGITLLSGRQFALFRPGLDDEARIEIWEMKLRR